jgi:hypothetical protein
MDTQFQTLIGQALQSSYEVINRISEFIFMGGCVLLLVLPLFIGICIYRRKISGIGCFATGMVTLIALGFIGAGPHIKAVTAQRQHDIPMRSAILANTLSGPFTVTKINEATWQIEKVEPQAGSGLSVVLDNAEMMVLKQALANSKLPVAQKAAKNLPDPTFSGPSK